ncbi:helix-turn-helix domain-containing protein [Nitrospirales bacterium NOB]|nr:helix-turn-helix domain-containing protein [Nitrospirales bacterium NOB]
MPNDKSIKEVEDWFSAEPPILSISRVAELLSCSQRQVHRYIKHGQLETLKFGTARAAKRSITRSSVVKFVAEHRVQGPAA